jgi:hypothetical protein
MLFLRRVPKTARCCARPTRPLRKLLSVSAPTLLGAILLASPARAEGWTYEGSLGIGSGLEGSSAETDSFHWQRGRFRLLAGLDLRSDEDEDQGLGMRAFAEIEKRGSLGAELRYSQWIGRGFGAYGGLTGTIAPETLIGGTVGCTAVIPLGNRVGLFIEPGLSALPFGGDLAGDSVLIWGLLTVGINVRL